MVKLTVNGESTVLRQQFGNNSVTFENGQLGWYCVVLYGSCLNQMVYQLVMWFYECLRLLRERTWRLVKKLMTI